MTDNRSHVIITGPAGSGKTTYAGVFAKHFALPVIEDSYPDGGERIPGRRRTLILTQESPRVLGERFPNATIYSIEEALALVGKVGVGQQPVARDTGEAPPTFDHMTTCATAHLASDRMLLIIEKHGWPKLEDGRCEDALEWLERHADRAGPTQNRIAVQDLRLDPVPF